MTNNYLPHLHILPEDRADRELANGFLLDDRVKHRNVQVLPPAGGWSKTIDSITSSGLEKFSKRHLLLLIDFDDHFDERMKIFREKTPEPLIDRVFILGSLKEPEDLRRSLGISFEAMGQQIAKDCAEGADFFWQHPLTLHNRAELERLAGKVRTILFSD